MRKILYFTDMPSPYKVKFLNLLNQTCDLVVYFERELHDDRNKEWIKDNNLQFNYENIFNVCSCFYKIPLIIYKSKPDFVFNCYYSSLRGIIVAISCFLLGRKMIIIADGGIPIKRTKIVEFGISKLMNLSYSCFSSGEETNKYFEYYKISPAKIYNYHFSSLTAQEIYEHNKVVKSNKDNNKFVILYVGQIIERKGIDILLNAIVGLEDIELYIVGGKVNNQLEKIIKDNKMENVHFHGFKTGKDLERYFADCDVFILPSRYEIWGLVVNEAISFNKPVITSNFVNAGLDLGMKYNCGLVFENGDVSELRNVILSLKNNRILYNKLADNCSKINKVYTIDQMAKDFADFINKC